METTTENTTRTSSLNVARRLVRQGILRLRCDETRRTFFGSSERRSRLRVPMRRVVYVTPVILEGRTLRHPMQQSASTVGYTSDVSTRGMAFTHDEPLLTKHAVVTFDLLDDDAISLVIEIKWSDCRSDRWYRSGGEFIGVTEPPESLCRLPAGGRSLFN